jgi:hypothetical protein
MHAGRAPPVRMAAQADRIHRVSEKRGPLCNTMKRGSQPGYLRIHHAIGTLGGKGAQVLGGAKASWEYNSIIAFGVHLLQCFGFA